MSPAGSPFDALVDEYDTARPSYPAELYDAIDHLGHRLAGADVIEVGAGTGIATRGLRDRGARVFAIDIGARMLGRLRERTPDQPAVLAQAEWLPFVDGSADLVCAAQAWHWVDLALAGPEVRRVLRSDGALAVWWNNVTADGEPWFEAQQERIERMNPAYSRVYRAQPYDDQLAAYFPRIDVFTVQWSRTLSIADYLVWLRSKSYVAAMGPRLGEFLDAEAATLREAFPDGQVIEPFEVRLVVAGERRHP
jgi:SAM-dependent methyltransferase